ncbi:P-loop containing nucleoside triphosphate hydrolase protein [Polychytrium aggregatum]|uniref:P-loop containing nucleoside triphosphate hydrolase protein n=1 Tax=Polychytrium aggregatum TaxID=110093 RepID=UPI0022FE0D76|nr:P-loop containing nucleoside triphosphate hydrolase protein [Polychytrium aggregatum]KAI9206276.1 P-loop containing nucleoside triphosphate hydrolase protein [Polychytrium aggregatum]
MSVARTPVSTASIPSNAARPPQSTQAAVPIHPFFLKATPSSSGSHDQHPSQPTTFHPYDPEAIKTWIYPTNKSIRDYQLNIVSKALFVNTLVALPTGLGKTFIAAVVMYNFYLWFPKGKIIFMAPTKPLVNQQIEACYTIVGLPRDDTDVLTGVIAPELRRERWKSKRVFFLTPNVMQNDLNRGTCAAEDVTLLVVDEAHRATGNYAYCEVVRDLQSRNPKFRVLALTATPGGEARAVQEVVKNLMISRIEIRTEESLDIKNYTHVRTLEPMVIEPSESIQGIANDFSGIAQKYLKNLIHAKVFYKSDPSVVSRFELMQARDRFRADNRAGGDMTPGKASAIEGMFGVAMSLCGSFNLLMNHGIKVFHSRLTEYISEAESSGNRVSRARREIINNPVFRSLMDRVGAALDAEGFVSHPKLDRLIDVVVKHFSDHAAHVQKNPQISAAEAQTRVMIFSQYRESVEEISAALKLHEPMVRCMSFVGQSAMKGKSKGKERKGYTQKEQLEVISKFQAGQYNVLVATCIGEEGLDIGDVDLIVCFDVQSSPIRMLQRMGRTGRKRDGRIVVLMSEGHEQNAFKLSQNKYKAMQKLITDGQGKKLEMYPEQHCRMLPIGTRPICIKKELEIPPMRLWRSPSIDTSIGTLACFLR